MLQRLGRLLWSQSREITVMNYPKHTVYAIFTNHGFIYVCNDKEKKTVHIIDDKMGEDSHAAEKRQHR